MHDYLILHGVNLNMFGRRDPAHYGTSTLADIDAALTALAGELGVRLDIFQTNHEGEMVERIHRALDDGTRGIVINAGAWTHYSYAIMDALGMLSIPVVAGRPPLRGRAGQTYFLVKKTAEAGRRLDFFLSLR